MGATDELRQTPLADRHREVGATMTAFGGWEMPLHYGSIVAEHRAVRDACGVFDLSHLGTLVVTGADAAAALQHTFTNDVTSLAEGQGQYTLCLDDEAGIVDDLLLFRFGWGFWVVPNAANAARVEGLVRASAEGRDCAVIDVKERTACLAVQGPRSPEVLLNAGFDPGGLDYLHGRDLAIPTPGEQVGGPRVPADAADATHEGTGGDSGDFGGVLTRSGYTGEVGFELVLPADRAPDVWDKVLAAGAEPVGLGARDTLRLEMGYALHGNDIHPGVTPVQARLRWAVAEGTGFRGEAAYAAAKAGGDDRRLWGLRAVGRGIPRAGQRVSRDGRDIGETTSGTFSPTCGAGIALAYLREAGPGDAVQIDVRGRPLDAEVVRPPFVEADPRS